MKVYYGYNKEPFLSELYVSDHLVDADFFPATDELSIIKWNLENPASEVTFVFKGNDSPEIYAIALDSQSGVAVDNIPMRGSSGLFFNNINREHLAQMYEELNVKLIILQFGGNYVPSDIDNFSGFENRFSSQISTLRELCPKAAILVVGVADMSMKDKNRYISYPNVEKVRDALRNAALKNNAAFWDLYEAMGGKNSMPSWVNATPPLATSDFVHFNTLGARTVANMLYNAIMYDYRKFLQQKFDDPFISEIN